MRANVVACVLYQWFPNRAQGTPAGPRSYYEVSPNSCLPALPLPSSALLRLNECEEGKAKMLLKIPPLLVCSLRKGAEGHRVGGKKSPGALCRDATMTRGSPSLQRSRWRLLSQQVYMYIGPVPVYITLCSLHCLARALDGGP